MPEAKSGIDFDDSNLDRWEQVQSVLLNRTIDISKTIHAFSQSRLRTNLDAWKSLMSCQAPAELVGLQRERVEKPQRSIAVMLGICQNRYSTALAI